MDNAPDTSDDDYCVWIADLESYCNQSDVMMYSNCKRLSMPISVDYADDLQYCPHCGKRVWAKIYER